MNNEYMDVVVVRFAETGKIYLFRAPAFSFLSTGDEVDVGAPNLATVLIRETFRVDDPALQKLTKAIGAISPLKRIRAKVERRVFEYPGEEEEF